MVALLGLGMVAGGLYMMHPPLALLIPGTVLVVLAIFAGRGRRP